MKVLKAIVQSNYPEIDWSNFNPDDYAVRDYSIVWPEERKRQEEEEE